LYIDPFKTRNIKDDLFLGRINHSFLIGSLVVIVLAVLLTIIVTRPIIRPMEELTEAVQKMEKGDLSVRVNIHSKDETGRLARAFNKMAESLSTLEQLRQNMVSDVAHELRTPLSNVRGYLEASRDGLLQTDENLVNNLYEEAMLLTRLVDDLQDLALAESGHLGLDFQPIEIGSLVETSIELCRTQAQSREIGLQTDISPGLPLIKADAQRLLQVFRNLINNALEHTPTGGKIIIAACPEQGNVHIRVTDNGIGIPSDQLELIFERFYRADPSRVRSTGGRGLGLSIVKKFINLHGGSVWAESQPGNGSTFHIILPGIQTI